ncbi:MAG: antibiotic biosynthesis monooxygenase [Chloroflexi bacterium]|nr:antibiotic biosynthesis monooxygenase [Chloroflexota bacterium]
MSVKVIMERTVKTGREKELAELLKELRSRGLHQPGYISGETLLDVDHPRTHIVISEWHSLDEWRKWEGSAERQGLVVRVERLLEQPTRTRVCIDAWGLPPTYSHV